MAQARTKSRLQPPEPESFEAQAIKLCDELRLAAQWERPSILFAVCCSDSVKDKAQTALVKLLELVGEKVQLYQVNDKENADIPLRLSRKHHCAQKVFFVEGLSQGGEGAVRALNIRREYFVSKQIRAVFWLSEAEERTLAGAAPDFWAFRHRVVYFKEDAGPGLS